MGNVVAIEQEKPAKKSAGTPTSPKIHRHNSYSSAPMNSGRKCFTFRSALPGFAGGYLIPIASARRRSGPYVVPQSAMDGFCNVENRDGVDATEDHGREYLTLPLDLRVFTPDSTGVELSMRRLVCLPWRSLRETTRSCKLRPNLSTDHARDHVKLQAHDPETQLIECGQTVSDLSNFLKELFLPVLRRRD